MSDAEEGGRTGGHITQSTKADGLRQPRKTNVRSGEEIEAAQINQHALCQERSSDEAALCLERAHENMRLADEAVLPEARLVHLRAAQHWEQLAKTANWIARKARANGEAISAGKAIGEA